MRIPALLIKSGLTLSAQARYEQIFAVLGLSRAQDRFPPIHPAVRVALYRGRRGLGLRTRAGPVKQSLLSDHSRATILVIGIL